MVVLNKVELRDPGGGGSRRQGGGCSSASRGDGLPLLADGSLTGSVAGVRTPRSRMQNNDRREDNFSPYLYEAIHEPPHLFQRHHPPQERNNFNRLSREDDNYTETTLFTSPSASSTTASIHPSTEEHWQHLMSSSVHEDQRTSSHRMLSSSSAPVFPVNNVHSSPPPHHTRIGGVYDPSNGGGHFISSSPEHEMDNDSHKMNITECTSFLDTKRLDRDKIEESLSLTGYFLSVLSLILFILDTGTDVLLGYFLFRSQSPWFYPTIGITLLSALIVNFFSLRWHLKDNKEKCTGWTKKRSIWSSPRFWWRICVHIILLGPVVRYFNLLKYGLLIRRETRRRQVMKELGRECRLATLGPIEMPLSLLRYPFQDSFSLPNHLKDSRDDDDSDYYIRFVHEDRDTAFLSLLKSFLESAPQLLLQSYIWTTSAMAVSSSTVSTSSLLPNTVMVSPPSSLTKTLVIVRGASIVTSLIHLSWSLSSYQRALRRLIPSKKVMSTSGAILQFLWRFFIIGSRVTAIVLFTSYFGCWMIPIAVAHWGVMTVWIMHQGTNFCDSTTKRESERGTRDESEDDSGEGKACQEYLFNMIIGVVYLICFISVKDEPTRIKYAAFYSLTFAQNTIFALSWYFTSTVTSTLPVSSSSMAGLLTTHNLHLQHHHLWFHLPVVVWVFASFFLGIFFMLLYYVYFHPNGRPLRVNRAAKCC